MGKYARSSDSPKWSPYNDGLLQAIGRVAAASAMLDQLLTQIIDKLAVSDIMWRIIVGQNTEWLLQSCRVLLDESDPYKSRHSPEQHEAILAQLAEAGRLRSLRNHVVHGIWRAEQFQDDWTRRRPWGSQGDETILYCTIGRTRRGPEEHAMTVGDVNRLADEISITNDRIDSLFRAISG